MWVKICGNTNLEDARLAVEAGADALGFVFAPSPRRVTIAQVQRIAANLPAQMAKYGVFVNAPFAEIVAAVEACGLTGVQLHHMGEQTLPSQLRQRFAGSPQELSVVRVLNLAAEGDGHPSGASERALDRALAQASEGADAVLVDSSNTAAAGGTGVSFDWTAAQASLLRAVGKMRIILAGGLRPENVSHAISTLRPWGVDVVSGVEAAPGKKDPARLAAFIQAVREAAAGVPEAK